MRKQVTNLFFVLCITSVVLIGCGNNQGNAAGEAVQTGEAFQLINTYNDSTRLTLLYDKTVSGNISCIVSQTDLGIATVDQFNNSTAAKITKTVTADDQVYDDYITTDSYGSLKTLYIYVLYDGKVHVLTGTTSTGAGSSSISGSVTGSTVMSTVITLPAGYKDDPAKNWPFVISIKGAYFGNLPCIAFHVNINYSDMTQYNADRDAVRNLINSIIAGATYIDGAPARIDRSHIYGFGFSAGGCAIMQIANDNASADYRFKALVGVGISDWIGQYYSGNLGDTNLWLFWGENDNPYGPETVAAFGYIPHGSGEHILTEMYGTGHTANPVVASPYMYQWLFSK